MGANQSPAEAEVSLELTETRTYIDDRKALVSRTDKGNLIQ